MCSFALFLLNRACESREGSERHDWRQARAVIGSIMLLPVSVLVDVHVSKSSPYM